MTTSTWMAVITDEHGAELTRYSIKNEEPVSLMFWARRYAADVDQEVDISSGHVPTGDFTVTLYDTERHTVGGVVNWESESFYFHQEY